MFFFLKLGYLSRLNAKGEHAQKNKKKKRKRKKGPKQTNKHAWMNGWMICLSLSPSPSLVVHAPEPPRNGGKREMMKMQNKDVKVFFPYVRYYCR